jgi:hypothetical protein
MEWTQERWDALAMNVELLVTLHGDNEKRMGQLTGRMEQLAETTKQLTERSAQLMDLSNRMGRILEAHDLSIDNHEARITDLENGGSK